MKKSFVLGLLIIISLLIAGCGTEKTGTIEEDGASVIGKTSETLPQRQDPLAGWETFTSPGHNMTLKYPPNWKKHERPAGQILVRFSNQDTKLTTGALIDKIEIIEQTITNEGLDDYIQKIKDAATNSLKGTIISEGDTKIDGTDAKYIIFEYSQGYEFKSKRVFLEKGELFLDFGLVSQKNEYTSNEVQFSSMISTIKFN